MDRTFFIQHDIGNCMIDDFLNLPSHRIIGIVYSVDDEAYMRHCTCFNLVH